ncbi:uncharacterized protein LOC120263097 [Dioscorea cayenensis subsp. rotundata]|uniref:Uncharacterized protein LOC120263097 n=1 Tax=Dioscorea cayennensis subsp. rotundata TaxID=55577 RepID=A0AB40BHS0_DIOCR|nr:uncharacterized protein LOC120263097 [Dioscorea cayenensis subsp. rotundata]
MSNLAKLDFVTLDISVKNYLSWVFDAEIHLNANGLGQTIKDGNQESLQNSAKAMIFLRHHLHEDLKIEYLTVKDPLELWKNLEERYNHQKMVILPKARYDWMHLRLQDFKIVSEYNSIIFRISSQLKLCGERIVDSDMLEKTFSTFHASNMLLQQQYQEKGFTKYSDLISCLLVAEQNNELLMKNHKSCSIGSAPFPEVNAITYENSKRGRGRTHGRRGHGVVMEEDVVGINIRKIMVIIKMHLTTRSGQIMKKNGLKAKKDQVTNQKIYVIDVVYKGTGCVPVVHQGTLSISIKHQ